jgi:hypothetical protein
MCCISYPLNEVIGRLIDLFPNVTEIVARLKKIEELRMLEYSVSQEFVCSWRSLD